MAGVVSWADLKEFRGFSVVADGEVGTGCGTFIVLETKFKAN